MNKKDFKTFATIIAIVVICGAILSGCGGNSSMSSCDTNAQSQSCQTNMKQLGLAVIQYVQDYDEKYPTASTLGTTPHSYGWATEIYSYLHTTSYFTCPSDPTSATIPLVPISYAMNLNMAGNSDARVSDTALTVMMCEIQGVTSNPRATDDMNDTSDFVTMSSVYNGGNLPGNVGKYATGSAPGETLTVISGGPVHQGMANYLTADGHVTPLLPSQISPGYDAPDTSNAENTTTGSNNASGTACMDNLPLDWGSSGCPHPGTATASFSLR